MELILKETKKRFAESEYIKKIWPESLRQKTLEYFDYQKVINIRLLDSDYKFSSDFDLDYLYKVLTNTSLTTLPKWILGDSVEEQVIINKLLAEKGTNSDKFYLQSARYAVSERNYDKAIELIKKHLIKYPADNNINAYSIYLFSLCMAGNIEEASELIEQLSNELEPAPENKKFIEWFHYNFGTKIPEAYL